MDHRDVQPVLTRRWWATGSRATSVAAVVVVASLALGCAASGSADAPDGSSGTTAPSQAGGTDPTVATTTAGLPTVGWFGDSTGLVLSEGSVYDAGGPVRITNLGGGAQLACSVGQGGQWRLPSGEVVGVYAPCADQLKTYEEFVEQHVPDMSVVLYGPNDLYDREIPEVCPTWCHIGDDHYDEWLHQQMLHVVDLLSRRGSLVVWLTTPPMLDLGDRTDQFNDMIRRLPDDRPGQVAVVDLDGYLRSSGKDAEYRSDGIHLSANAAVVVGQGWLVPQLVELWNHR